MPGQRPRLINRADMGSVVPAAIQRGAFTEVSSAGMAKWLMIAPTTNSDVQAANIPNQGYPHTMFSDPMPTISNDTDAAVSDRRKASSHRIGLSELSSTRNLDFIVAKPAKSFL
ncbi:hypothetical protein [Allorhodopirellula solitaria]|uniref:hypothetical protein n=1 Tax=Allorhodopirellula solitaria TaxID=2527987 RepID=UPI001FEB0F37|nr:hypothetical protein [Allorhodopirellula solitaria]